MQKFARHSISQNVPHVVFFWEVIPNLKTSVLVLPFWQYTSLVIILDFSFLFHTGLVLVLGIFCEKQIQTSLVKIFLGLWNRSAMVSIYPSVVQYQLKFLLDLGINIRLIISSIYARMLVWVQGLSYYIMVFELVA